MKKTILLTSIAALTALSSCTMDEIKEVNQGTPIGFRTSVATRGVDVYNSSLDGFYCTAWITTEDEDPYFENLYFGNQDRNFISNPTYYWPKGKSLNFYAYAPGVGDATVSIDKESQTITGYQVPENIDEQDDLIFATNTGNDGAGVSEQADVQLLFAHMLSKINVYAKTNSSLYTYKFAGVRIGGVKMTGDVDLATAIWTPTEGSEGVCERTDENNPIDLNSWAYNLIGKLFKGSNESTNFAFMIPQEFEAWDPITDPTNTEQGAYISVYTQINTADGTRVYPAEGEDYGWVAIPIPAGEWEAGYQYTYTLDFTDGAGYIDPATPGITGGGSVLGEAIKVTMTMEAMKDAGLGVTPNEDMIGVWEAHYYKSEYYSYEQNTETQEYNILDNKRTFILDDFTKTITYDYYDWDSEKGESVLNEEKTTTTIETISEQNFFGAINENAGNFGYVEIHDGKKLITKREEQYLESPYTVERIDKNGDGTADIVMYIDTYKENDGTYSNIPIIEEIIPVSANGNGAGTVKAYFEGTSWKQVITIYYTISPLPQEETTEPTE